MKAKGIIYTGESICAKLKGLKTQTRRIVKPQPIGKFTMGAKASKEGEIGIIHNERYEGELLHCDFIKCPYGKIGDLLYAKETWRWFDAFIESDQDGVYSGYQYRADVPSEHDDGIKWKSPIYMPKKAARIIDEITEIRVERIQEITWQDAIREGIEMIMDEDSSRQLYKNYTGEYYQSGHKELLPKDSYKSLWISINGQASWDNNDYVWVITTKNLSLTGWDGIKK